MLGLQTPRLKRLAEIVSAQAIAQQEKLEYEQANGGKSMSQGSKSPTKRDDDDDDGDSDESEEEEDDDDDEDDSDDSEDDD